MYGGLSLCEEHISCCVCLAAAKVYDKPGQALSLCCGMQAQDSIAQSRPEAAQARGRALLNLRLQDAEGGLLGRTLLTLVSNKVGGCFSFRQIISPMFMAGILIQPPLMHCQRRQQGSHIQ